MIRALTYLSIFTVGTPLFAQSPWENAVDVLRTAFTGPIARGLSLVAIVVGGIMFAFGEGESNQTGPLLYGVVDRTIGSHEGFAYSAGMEEHKAKGDLWSYDNLNAFLTSPKTFTPGTKMSLPTLPGC